MSKNVITKEKIADAWDTLRKYKSAKANFENKIVKEEMFYKQRHWEILRKEGEAPKPTSGWMFNSIANKHADAMDSYPEAICRPREESDEESAKILSSIIPVILERNNFEGTYSDNKWYWIKHGTCAYGVFWNSELENGLGDVQIKKIDMLNIFYEPGITDLQKSRNLFICDLVPVDVLKASYPKAEIKGGEQTEIKKYIYDDDVDTSDKALVVDWYYKKGGKLHYCKFCEDNILFASENENGYENGWYEDGEYPIEIERFYPEEGTITGFGVIAQTKDAQLYIDTLDNLAMDYINASARVRVITKKGSGVNEKDVLDLNKAVIEVDGDVDERRIKQLTLSPMSNGLMNLREAKINELKETSSNRDFSQGGTAGGVTSGAAIAVLQEAGSKTSRDMTKESYRTYKRVIGKVIERIRQFYTVERTFRITGENGQYSYVQFGNSRIAEQSMGIVGDKELFRKPVFDIDIKPQKQNPFNTLSQNETVMNLYKAGLFAPENAQTAMAVLELMDFEGKSKALDFVKQGATLQNQLMQMNQQMQMLMQENAMLKNEVGTNNPSTASGPPPFTQGRL